MPLSQPTTCMCFEKMGESTRQIQSSGKQAEAGLPSFEANHRRAFLLELIRYFWAKKQCSFASQAFQIITAAIAIKGCSPALLNFSVYYCKVNVRVDDQPWRYVFNRYFWLIRSPVEILRRVSLIIRPSLGVEREGIGSWRGGRETESSLSFPLLSLSFPSWTPSR